jgi:uncharacterized membrane protein YkoI
LEIDWKNRRFSRLYSNLERVFLSRTNKEKEKIMKNKLSLMISVFVTVFILTVGIGVITKVSANNSSQTNSSPTVDAAAFAQREQAYQKIIADANQQIQLANQQITTLANQITPQTPVQSSQTYAVTPDQASSIAQQTTGSAPLSAPSLVDFSGTPAYEVVYTAGNIYIDATTGAILFNGLPKPATYITSEQALNVATNYLTTSQPVAMGTSSFNGERVYVVLFADGQTVFVDRTGKVVAVQMAAPSQPSNNSDTNNESESSESD